MKIKVNYTPSGGKVKSFWYQTNRPGIYGIAEWSDECPHPEVRLGKHIKNTQDNNSCPIHGQRQYCLSCGKGVMNAR